MQSKALRFDGDRQRRTVLLADGRIAALDDAARTAPAEETLDCGGAVIEPGRINAHTHIYSGLAPLGMPPPSDPPQTFVQILERVWWLLDRALDERSLRAAARLYCAEALLAGTTTLVDHHESPRLIDGVLDLLAEVAEELGIRVLLCFGATERNGGRAEGRAGLAECKRFLELPARDTIRGAVALHASFTVSDETVREAGELCRALGAPLHVHLAEAASDVADAQQRGYDGPLERLIALDALPEGSILAHGVHLSADQVRRCAERGCWIVQNPRSNRGNAVGYNASLGASELVALGTDGYPAKMDEEVAALAEEAAAHADTAWEPRIHRAPRLAERLFGVPFTLAAGGAADVGAFVEGRPRHLVVGGRLVIRDGALLTGDIEAIRAEARAEAPRLWERMRAL